MRSKEDRVLELFFNSPKHWHFEDLLEKADISRPQLNRWLKQLSKENIIKRIKLKGKMPYYTGNFNNPNYKNKKRLFALEKFYKTGFLNHLASCDADTIIIFGSFARSDWYKDSDIDLFVYGKAKDLNLAKYELKLKREIQLFHFKKKQDIKKLDKGVLPNIVNGFTVKGNLDFLNLKGGLIA